MINYQYIYSKHQHQHIIQQVMSVDMIQTIKLTLKEELVIAEANNRMISDTHTYINKSIHHHI